MNDMIDDLFNGNLDLSLLEFKKGSAYNKKRHEILTLIDEIGNAGQGKAASRLSDTLNDLDYIISRAYFTIGFRWGARMALAMMRDDNDTFNPTI